MQQPRWFRLKKWFLIFITSLGTFFTGIAIAILVTFFMLINPFAVGAFPDNADGQREFSRNKIRAMFVLVMLAYYFVTCLFGLIGIIRENFCMTAFFVVTQLISSVFAVIVDIFNGFWSDLLIEELVPIIVILLGIFYLRDLYDIRKQLKLDAENNEMVSGGLDQSSKY